jgi:Zn-dependent protease/predicted transcriptional regulator
MRSWSIPIGRVLGVELRVHVTFLFLLAFVLLYDPTGGGTSAVLRAMALTGLVLISVVLHELAHAVAAAHMGAPMRASILLPIGGIPMAEANAQPDPSQTLLRREVFIALAGPVLNLLIAGICGIVLLALGSKADIWKAPPVTLTDLGRSFFWINASLFVFNILPAFPLDGGRVFRALRARTRDFRAATRQAVNLGHVFAALFMLAGITSQWLVLIGLILFMAAQMEERTVMFQSVVEAVHMEDIMLTEFSTLSPADTLEDALNKAVHSLQDDFPVIRGEDLVGVITRQAIVERLRREGNGYVQSVMNKAFEIASRKESLGSAFRKLTRRGLTLIPVVDEDRLVGIVTLQNLMHSMGLLAESRRLRKQMEQQI